MKFIITRISMFEVEAEDSDEAQKLVLTTGIQPIQTQVTSRRKRERTEQQQSTDIPIRKRAS